MTDTPWYDVRLMFPVAGIAAAMTFLSAVRAAGFMGGAGRLPDNMLGDPRDASGAVVAPPADDQPDTRAFNGRPGRAAFSYTDDNGNQVDVPAAGDPAMMYMHLRTPVSPADRAALQASLGLNPATAGISPSDPTVSAAVLGVWE